MTKGASRRHRVDEQQRRDARGAAHDGGTIYYDSFIVTPNFSLTRLKKTRISNTRTRGSPCEGS